MHGNVKHHGEEMWTKRTAAHAVALVSIASLTATLLLPIVGPGHTTSISIILVLIGVILYQQGESRRKGRRVFAIDVLKRHRKKLENPYLEVEKVIQRARIEGANLHVEREYIGENISNKVVESFATYAMGDNERSWERINFKAYQVIDKKRTKLASFANIDEEPSVFKLIDVKFRQPLGRNEKFHIITSYKWDGAMSQRDYLKLLLSPYKPSKGSEFAVIFGERPKHWNLRGERTGDVIHPKEKENKKLELKFTIPKNKVGEDYILDYFIA